LYNLLRSSNSVSTLLTDIVVYNNSLYGIGKIGFVMVLPFSYRIQFPTSFYSNVFFRQWFEPFWFRFPSIAQNILLASDLAPTRFKNTSSIVWLVLPASSNNNRWFSFSCHALAPRTTNFLSTRQLSAGSNTECKSKPCSSYRLAIATLHDGRASYIVATTHTCPVTGRRGIIIIISPFSFLSSYYIFVHPVCVKRPTTARARVCVYGIPILVFVSYGIVLLWFRTGYTAGRFYVCTVFTIIILLLLLCTFVERRRASFPCSDPFDA